MLPDPDSSPDSVSESSLLERGMSADAVDPPSPSIALAHPPSPAHVDAAHRAPCACPCLKEGPRASLTSPVKSSPGDANQHGSVCDAAPHDQRSDAARHIGTLAEKEPTPKPEFWAAKINPQKLADAASSQALVEKDAEEEEADFVRSGLKRQEDNVSECNLEEKEGVVCGGSIHAAAGADAKDSVDGRANKENDRMANIKVTLMNHCDPVVGNFYYSLITDGDEIPGDSGVSLDDKPEWVDMEKIRVAQRFANKYFFGLMFSEMLSLFVLFSSPGSLQPLIFTGNSDTPFKAFQRYLSTVSRVASWYSGDLWAEGEARNNLRVVRRLHDLYRRRLNALRDAPSEERVRATSLKGPLWTHGSAETVRADFASCASTCPILNMARDRCEWINQMEMSITQMGFVGLAVTYPDRFGMVGASTEELESFVHLWRIIGHLLGVEERFNFCSEGLDGVRKRTKFLMATVIPSNLAWVGDEWEHMSRCVVAGVNHYMEGITFEVSLMYLLETVGLDAPCVKSSLTAREHRMYRIACFLLHWVLRIPPLRALINWGLRRNLKRAQNPPAEWLRRKQERVYSYQRKRSEKSTEPVRQETESAAEQAAHSACEQ